MIRLHGNRESAEFAAARMLKSTLEASFEGFSDSSQPDLHIVVEQPIQHGRVRHADILLAGQLPSDACEFLAKRGITVPENVVAIVEAKTHGVDSVEVQGGRVSVQYPYGLHDATGQVDRQSIQLAESFGRMFGCHDTRVADMIFFPNIVATAALSSAWPRNVLFGSDKGHQVVEKVASRLAPHFEFARRGCVPSLYYGRVIAHLTSVEQMTNMDRRRLERLTADELGEGLDDLPLGERLMMFRGRAGTGKTMRLLQAAHRLRLRGMSSVFLTYNRVLAVDVERLVSFTGLAADDPEAPFEVRTIHSFIGLLATALRIEGPNTDGFEGHSTRVDRILECVGGSTSDEVRELLGVTDRRLVWDYMLVDEGQDWPDNERSLLRKLVGHDRLLVADGIDQVVRDLQPRTSWRDGLMPAQHHVEALTRALRMKAGLARFASEFAAVMGVPGWRVAPVPEAAGGKVRVVVGSALDRSHVDPWIASANTDGNEPVDVLVLEPNVRPGGWNSKENRVLDRLVRQGLRLWDGTSTSGKGTRPKLGEVRFIKYESARGLEAWTVFAVGFDQHYDELSNQFDQSAVASKLLIALTRAVDTIVLHVTEGSHAVLHLLREVAERSGVDFDVEHQSIERKPVAARHVRVVGRDVPRPEVGSRVIHVVHGEGHIVESFWNSQGDRLIVQYSNDLEMRHGWPDAQLSLAPSEPGIDF